MKQFWTYNFKYFLIGGVLLVIFMWWKGCGNKGGEAAKDYKHQYDSVVTLLDKKDADFVDADKRASFQKDRSERLETELLKANDVIDDSEKDVTRLSKEVKKLSKTEPPSKFVDTCTALAEKAQQFRDDANNFSDIAFALSISKDSLENALNEKIRIKDEMYDACKKALDYGAKEILPQLKPRLEFYGGGGVLGNKTQPLSGFSASLAMKNKTGQIFKAGSVWVNGQQYYQGEVLLRLSFRKH